MQQEINKKFLEALEFSKKKFKNRLFLKPIFTLRKVLISKIYNLFFRNRPIFVSEKTFWGDKMLMVLPEDASLYHWKMVPGEEENLTSYMIDTIKNDWIVIDIGANHGYYSLLLSELVGKNGKVYCFEPTPSTVEILKKNTEKNTNIKVEQCAIWSKNVKLKFTDYGQGFSAYNSFLPDIAWKDKDAPKIKTEIQVDGIMLDYYLEKNKITPNFIKLDVEGAELDSLEGMRNALIKQTPIISVEFWVNELWNENNDKILNFFKDINYTAYSIQNNKLLKFYEGNIKFEHDYTNLIFTPNK